MALQQYQTYYILLNVQKTILTRKISKKSKKLCFEFQCVLFTIFSLKINIYSILSMVFCSVSGINFLMIYYNVIRVCMSMFCFWIRLQFQICFVQTILFSWLKQKQ